MIQPIMVTSQEPDGRIVQQTQYQIIRQSDDTVDTQSQALQVVHFYALYTPSQNRIPNIIDCHLKKDRQILIIFSLKCLRLHHLRKTEQAKYALK